nr:glycosyltransferase [Caldisericia bacterium]
RNKGLAFKEREKDTVRILIEGPVDVPFKNVPKTVKLCREAGVGEIWLLTSSDIDNYPGVDRVFSKLSIFDTPLVYRSCDILVKLSYVEGMFGPPLEMFHCGGTAIVYNVTGHDEYIRHKKNAFVVKRDNDTMVVKYLRKLKNDPTLLKQMKQEAIKTANEWYGWEDAVVEFEKATQHIFLNIPTPSRRDLLSKEKFFKSSYNIHQESLDLINKSKLLKIENNIRRVRRNVFDKIRSLSQDN